VLVLSRKPDESIVIGADIFITVISVKGDTVRLGIEAPREVPVRRSELSVEAIKQVRQPKPPTDQ